MKPLLFSHFTIASCIGRGRSQTLEALRQRKAGLTRCDFDTVDLETYIGVTAGVDDIAMRPDLREYDCRNNRLLQLALEQDGFADAIRSATAKYGRDRVGVFLGTSTSGILQTELAYRKRDGVTGKLPADFIYRTTHNSFSAADFTHRYFGLTGPAVAVSSACSSSAKVFGSARRMIEAGMIDAAVVGGVDSLCLTTLYGFNSLGLVSSQPCRPYDALRNGISIGEAAAVVLLERVPESVDADAVLLLGIGESSDAYHMSSPHPDGLGAKIAMQNALSMAGMTPDRIDYINLHGTATATNDASEGKAVAALFGSSIPCSSTKGATGHTLGAAGGIEAVICALALQHGLMPGGLNTKRCDPELPLNYLLDNREQRVDHALSNSFGFGGTNCSLVFGRAN
ncbi:MAG: 3-oxoacyl-ACP synthase [Herminiimonas sp.]|nr:3-oxoacyl-ACP synthase [Herminiimonas sp.]